MKRMRKASRGLVAVNEKGRRIGESHPRAKLTDHEVDLIFALVAEGMLKKEIAEKMEISRQHLCSILKGRYREQVASRWRRVGPRARRAEPSDER